MTEFDTLLLGFTLDLLPFLLRRLRNWGNGAGDVNVDVKDTCTAGCNDADGNLVGDDNDPDDGTLLLALKVPELTIK